jgi:hypothetical protein
MAAYWPLKVIVLPRMNRRLKAVGGKPRCFNV